MTKLGIIGFSGSGKSIILKHAKADGLKTLDTDEMLEKRINIERFILDNDLIKFRKLERSVVIEALESDVDVIAFGGGMHSEHISWTDLKKADIKIVFLRQSFDRCIERAPDRPLLKKVGLQIYRQIYETRQEKYLNAAEKVVNVNSKESLSVWQEVKSL